MRDCWLVYRLPSLYLFDYIGQFAPYGLFGFRGLKSRVWLYSTACWLVLLLSEYTIEILVSFPNPLTYSSTSSLAVRTHSEYGSGFHVLRMCYRNVITLQLSNYFILTWHISQQRATQISWILLVKFFGLM